VFLLLFFDVSKTNLCFCFVILVADVAIAVVFAYLNDSEGGGLLTKWRVGLG
jgi:hypothetical protein